MSKSQEFIFLLMFVLMLKKKCVKVWVCLKLVTLGNIWDFLLDIEGLLEDNSTLWLIR